MLKINKLIYAAAISRKFHLTAATKIDQDWRRKMRFPINPNTESLLTSLPDYSYIDGRPTPIGRNQKRRLIKQRELSSKIVDGINEINYAMERFKQLTEKAESERKKILDSKLKMKGFKMLKS